MSVTGPHGGVHRGNPSDLSSSSHGPHLRGLRSSPNPPTMRLLTLSQILWTHLPLTHEIGSSVTATMQVPGSSCSDLAGSTHTGEPSPDPLAARHSCTRPPFCLTAPATTAAQQNATTSPAQDDTQADIRGLGHRAVRPGHASTWPCPALASLLQPLPCDLLLAPPATLGHFLWPVVPTSQS